MKRKSTGWKRIDEKTVYGRFHPKTERNILEFKDSLERIEILKMVEKGRLNSEIDLVSVMVELVSVGGSIGTITVSAKTCWEGPKIYSPHS